MDQIAEVIRLLKEDPNNRRAVISLWDPSEDMCISKDIPCNNWLHFQVRDGYLYLNIAQRSSDVLWGLSGIDIFSWSVLMEMVAFSLNVKIGAMTYFISNLHLYERHWERGNKIICNSTPLDSMYYPGDVQSIPWDTEFYLMDDDLDSVFALEESDREQTLCDDCDCVRNHFLDVCHSMLYLYNMYLNKRNVVDVAFVLSAMKTCDFKIAAIEYFHRMIGDVFDENIDDTLTDLERLIVSDIFKEIL